MTINAKEAKAATTAYINNIAADHIKCIEDLIRERAGKGFTCIYYNNGIYNADSRVKTSVWQELKEAGFKVCWCDLQLHVSWEEA
jgi:hypothetical protein